MVCHEGVARTSPAIRRLAGLHKEGGAVEWVRIYRVPDYVFFSHGRHARAKVECESCHGPVARREALEKEKRTDMRSCMACHKARGASIACQVCHELGQ